jgi:plasmid stabilization system protein ParE
VRRTVTWDLPTQDELTRIWLGAADRNAVSRAANLIDAALRTDAESKGIEFCGDRLLVESPLAVTYAIDDANRQVRVLQVWHLERPEMDG